MKRPREIISIKGELIETNFFANLEQGFYSHLWDAKEYSSWIYFSRLLVDGKIVGLNKMLLVK